MEAARDLLKNLPVSAPAPAAVLAPAAAPVAVAASAPAPAAAAESVPSGPAGPTINSPMVGTFYRSAAPGEKSFANIGDSVDENTTVCIIEAMKVMNEIKAEARGTITRILAEDGKPVQYGQPLFELKA
jgi:acetyl-CoA carboxylase biotin carboxyl carrier protein